MCFLFRTDTDDADDLMKRERGANPLLSRSCESPYQWRKHDVTEIFGKTLAAERRVRRPATVLKLYRHLWG